MFVEEALWVNKTLSPIQPLPDNNRVANLGSSTNHFRTVIQPHIHQYITDPLTKKNWQVLNIDLKKEEGVDLVANVSETSFAHTYKDFFALTICTNMLEHVENIPAVIQHLLAVTKKKGYILITVPHKYKLHFDPIDNGFRPKPQEIISLFKNGTVTAVAEQIIRINQKNYYPVKKSKFPLWGYRERLKYFLGIRHKVSGVLLHVNDK